MKTVWVCVLLSLWSMVANGGAFSEALSDAGQPQSGTPASQSTAATPPLLNAPAGVIALDTFGRSQNRSKSTSMSAPAPTNSGSNLPSHLSEYLYLHRTWRDSIAAPRTAGSSACPE
jgi:hypothetical protein